MVTLPTTDYSPVITQAVNDLLQEWDAVSVKSPKTVDLILIEASTGIDQLVEVYRDDAKIYSEYHDASAGYILSSEMALAEALYQLSKP